jgi:hypothetical protein
MGLVVFQSMALLPFLTIAIWALAILKGTSVDGLALRQAMAIGIIGLVFAGIAFRQYGHATPLFLVIGYCAQWLAIIRGFLKARRPS